MWGQPSSAVPQARRASPRINSVGTDAFVRPAKAKPSPSWQLSEEQPFRWTRVWSRSYGRAAFFLGSAPVRGVVEERL